MNQSKEFTWEIINMADDLFYNRIGRPLTKVEKELLKCFLNDMNYEDIFTHLHNRGLLYYNKNYLSEKLVSDLMRDFSRALKQPVNKKRLKEPFRWTLERATQANLGQVIMPIELFLDFLIDTTQNNRTYAQGIENERCSLDYTRENIFFRDFEIECMRQAGNGKKYNEIRIKRPSCNDEQCESYGECRCTYSVDHISKSGSKVLKKVSTILNKSVTKGNFPDIVKQWHKDQKYFVWKLNLVATSLETEDLTFAEDRPAKMQRFAFYALITLFY